MIMRVSVVHESMVGNTRQIAEAIGASLAESGDVAALEVSAATAGAVEVVIGAGRLDLAREGRFSALLRHPLFSKALQDPRLRQALGL